MGKRTSPYPQNPQKELTNAAVVAQFLGIPVPPSANSLRVSEAIQRNIDGLIREIDSLKSKNQDLAEKHQIATGQIERLLQQARDLGITLTLGKIRPSAPPNVEPEKSTSQIMESQSTEVGQDSQDSQWASKRSRRSSKNAKQGEAAA
jgi:cellulose biosynthesis protein BcsQ